MSTPWRRATWVWMLITLVEALQGTAREVWVAPLVGGSRARQFAVLTGCALIFVIAWCTVCWIAARSRREWLLVGVFWVAMTIAFEITLGRVLGMSWGRIAADYNPTAGGFMIFGLAFMAMAPLWAARLRKLA